MLFQTARVAFTFADRDNNSGETNFYVDSGIDKSEIATDVINTAIPILESVSDAIIPRFRIIYSVSVANSVALETSNIRRVALFFIQNEEGRLEVFYLPSPINIFEDTGDYAGIRIDPSKVSDFIAYLTSGIPRRIDGSSLGNTFLVGGKAY